MPPGAGRAGGIADVDLLMAMNVDNRIGHTAASNRLVLRKAFPVFSFRGFGGVPLFGNMCM